MLIAVVVILFLYQPVRVEGTSMMPSLVDQERIFINKFVYRFGIGDIERGDTVVFWFPGDPSKSFIKRVIGVPGDMVEVTRRQVFVNGRRSTSRMCRKSIATMFPKRRTRGTAGRLLCAGRPSQFFERQPHLGHRPAHDIYGKAVFVYWPPDRMGLLR